MCSRFIQSIWHCGHPRIRQGSGLSHRNKMGRRARNARFSILTTKNGLNTKKMRNQVIVVSQVLKPWLWSKWLSAWLPLTQNVNVTPPPIILSSLISSRKIILKADYKIASEAPFEKSLMFHEVKKENKWGGEGGGGDPFFFLRLFIEFSFLLPRPPLLLPFVLSRSFNFLFTSQVYGNFHSGPFILCSPIFTITFEDYW